MMLFIGTFVNKSFTFSVSVFTVLRFCFLREGNEVFFSDINLFMISSLFSSSLKRVCFVLFSVCFFFGFSGFFSEFSVSVSVLGIYSYVCLHILSVDFQYFKIRKKQSLFIIVLIWPVILWFIALNLTNSVQMSIFLFSILSFYRVSPKISL